MDARRCNGRYAYLTYDVKLEKMWNGSTKANGRVAENSNNQNTLRNQPLVAHDEALPKAKIGLQNKAEGNDKET
jgi:hypothetical protein